MASKNMFEVLRRDDSDDEVERPKKQTKHEQRADDKQKREAVGDKVEKQNYHDQNRENRPQKNTYGGQGKRTHDRQSGTGGNTFNKHEKKQGGGGKGNWGNAEQDNAVEGENKEEKKEVTDQPEEQGEPVLTLDDYMKENAMNLEFKVQESGESGHQTTDAGKGLKVMKPKVQDWVKCEEKVKNIDNISKTKTSQIEGLEPVGYRRQGTNQNRNKGKKASDLKNEDFPALG